MMGGVVEDGIPDHHVSRIFANHPPANQQLPGRHQMFVGRFLESLTRLSYILVEEFLADRTTIDLKPANLEDALRLLGDRVDPKPQGYAVDRQHPTVIYVPENAHFNVREGSIRWQRNGAGTRLSIRPENVYVFPSGYRVRMEKQLGGATRRLVGTRANALL